VIDTFTLSSQLRNFGRHAAEPTVSPSCRCVVSRVSGALLIVPGVSCLFSRVSCLRYSNFNNKTFEMHMLFTDALHREYYICTRQSNE
jgi:hypothetical protein